MSQKIKIMGYNIHACIDRDWKKSTFDAVLDVIRSCNPDILGLEEVLTRLPICLDMNMPEDIGRALDMQSFFGQAMKRTFAPDTYYGVAALTRFKATAAGKIFLPTPEGAEPRVLLAVRIEAEKPFYFLVTHFSYEGEYEISSAYREQAARLITKTVRENHWFPAILTGDLNSGRGSSIDRIFHEDWDICNDMDPLTPSVEGDLQIDYICTYPKGAFKLHEFGFIDDLKASDHKPVTAVLEQV